MDTREALAQASEFIKNKQYTEARAILVKLDHPLAEQWLNKVDALIAKKKRETSSEIRTVMTSPRAASEKRLTRATSENRAARTTSSAPAISPDKPKLKSPETVTKAKNTTRSDTIPAAIFIVGLIGMLIIGVGGGVLLFLSSKLTYLIFLSPIIAAGIVSLCLAQLFKSFKMRDWLIAGTIGAMTGLIAYGVYRAGEYFDFRESFYHEAIAEVGAFDRGEFEIYVDEMLIVETGQAGFIGFTLMQAQEGMTVTSTRSSRSPSTWSSEITVLYWLAEIAIFVGLPFFLIRQTLTEPFCDETNEWMQFRQIGTVSFDRSSSFLQLVSQGIMEDAAQLMQDDRKMARTSLYVSVGRCHAQSSDAILRVKQVQGRNQKEVFKETITAAQYNALVAAV
jgi:hypothetical protein